MDNSQQNNNEKIREKSKAVAGVLNKWSAIQAIFSIIFTVSLTLILSILAFVFIGGKDAFIISAFLLAICVFVVFINAPGFKLFSKKIKNGDEENPFQGTAALTTKTIRIFEKATYVPDEKVVSWIGPVDCINFDRQNYALGIEVVAAPENTLILTPEKLIAVALVQKDFDVVESGSSVLNAFAQVATISTSASEQERHLALLNRGKWSRLMEQVHKSELEKLIETHWQFGISRKEIKKIELKLGMMNPGIHIYLESGKILKYSTLNKNLIKPFGEKAKEIGIEVQV